MRSNLVRSMLTHSVLYIEISASQGVASVDINYGGAQVALKDSIGRIS